MELGVLKISSIEVGDRFREDYGNLEELAASIKEKELINPITVTCIGEGSYRLAAGGRRLAACKLLQMEEIACRIYDKELSELELRVIELEENIKRKDLSFIEECNMKKEMLRLQQELYGIKTSTSPDAEGVSMRDVAKSIGLDHSQLSRDIELANVMEMFPEIGWGKLKTKAEAIKTQKKIEETFLRQELSKRVEKSMGAQGSSTFVKKLAQSYIIEDFFKGAANLPNNIFDLVEIDPPYAIDLVNAKKNYTYEHEKYNEVSQEEYPEFMKKVFSECFRLMTSNSWLICWHATEWQKDIFQWLIGAGFRVCMLPGMWAKPTGQAKNPSTQLASCYEPFYYAWKGAPVLAKQGRGNVFAFNPVPASSKMHPTERPMELIEELLTTFSMENSRVLVPFSGSGNTLIAAAKNKMIPVGFDLTEAYRNSYIMKLQKLFMGGEK